MALVLLTEGNNFNADVAPLCESEGGKKKWFLEGDYSETDVKNRNNRIYGSDDFSREVKVFNEEKITSCCGYGEADHPKVNAHEVTQSNVAILISKLYTEGNKVRGKARVIDNAPGLNIQAMLEAGGRVSVSSRGLGTLDEKTGRVRNDFKLITFDAVLFPSSYAADKIKGVTESVLDKVYEISAGGVIYERALSEFEKKLHKHGTRQLKEDLGTYLQSLFGKKLIL